ncbi:divergent polysaccharide deacetylase family protein, partial [Nostoc sp. NIES-2111]
MSDGKRPFDVYSQLTPLAVTHSDRPKITLVLGGLGLNARLTRKAIAMLPGDVTLGFAPYGDNLQALVNEARAQGHEILLQLPMEPVGYPGTSPGPRTLLSDASPEQNRAALQWLMSRFAGYSGITNYMGARLLVSADALRPVMREVQSRGLAYLEDASVNRTLSPKLAQELRLPIQRASAVIDAEPTAPAIMAALGKLEAEATQNGSAIATGSGLDVTIET